LSPLIGHDFKGNKKQLSIGHFELHKYDFSDFFNDISFLTQPYCLFVTLKRKYFEAETDGLLSSCGYVEDGCQDDCFVGIHIAGITGGNK
jgi:hypothetical protein